MCVRICMRAVAQRQVCLHRGLKPGFLPLLEIRENWKAFSSQGKVREFGNFSKIQEKIREF